MKYEIRPSTESDYEFCYNVTKKNMYNLFCRHWGGWVDSEFHKGYIAENIQVIMVDGKQVGYFSHKNNNELIYIDNIQISSEQQGKGIGTSVLMSFLCEHKDSIIRLTTFEDNPAMRLYHRLGFEVVEKEGFTLKMEKRPIKAVEQAL